MANANLTAARRAKQDEFYTQWADIEREMNAYLEYDPDVFRGKTILLPCDDPEWSNFTKFFALHFTEYGLKKLISTSYAPNSNAGAALVKPRPGESSDPGRAPHSREHGCEDAGVPRTTEGVRHDNRHYRHRTAHLGRLPALLQQRQARWRLV